MNKYAVTTTKFEGTVVYGFDDKDWLASVELQNIHEPHAHRSVCSTLPKTKAELMSWVDANKTMHITELIEDVSFEAFWKLYDYKMGKKEAEAAWNKLSPIKRAEAIQALPKYNRWLTTSNVPKMYPQKYLNKERFYDDFK